MVRAKQIWDYVATKKFWVEFLIMTFGMILTAICVHYFLVPSKLIIGTISGLSIVLATVSESLFGVHLEVSVMIFVINAILLVLAYFLIGKEFGIKTVYTALILGPFTALFEKYLPYQMVITKLYGEKSAFFDATAASGWSPVAVQDGVSSLMGDPWFDLVCFVLILSFSQATLFKINASTGGLDILAKIVKVQVLVDNLGQDIQTASGSVDGEHQCLGCTEDDDAAEKVEPGVAHHRKSLVWSNAHINEVIVGGGEVLPGIKPFAELGHGTENHGAIDRFQAKLLANE